MESACFLIVKKISVFFKLSISYVFDEVLRIMLSYSHDKGDG